MYENEKWAFVKKSFLTKREVSRHKDVSRCEKEVSPQVTIEILKKKKKKN